MTSESPKPPLRLTIEGLRWTGEDFATVGEAPADLDLMDTDSASEAGQIHSLLWSVLVRRTVLAMGFAHVRWDALDFDAPNLPTETDLAGVIERVEVALANLRALKQLAPEVIEGDDDGDDNPPAPEPEPAPTTRAEAERDA